MEFIVIDFYHWKRIREHVGIGDILELSRDNERLVTINKPVVFYHRIHSNDLYGDKKKVLALYVVERFNRGQLLSDTVLQGVNQQTPPFAVMIKKYEDVKYDEKFFKTKWTSLLDPWAKILRIDSNMDKYQDAFDHITDCILNGTRTIGLMQALLQKMGFDFVMDDGLTKKMKETPMFEPKLQTKETVESLPRLKKDDELSLANCVKLRHPCCIFIHIAHGRMNLDIPHAYVSLPMKEELTDLSISGCQKIITHYTFAVQAAFEELASWCDGSSKGNFNMYEYIVSGKRDQIYNSLNTCLSQFIRKFHVDNPRVNVVTNVSLATRQAEMNRALEILMFLLKKHTRTQSSSMISYNSLF